MRIAQIAPLAEAVPPKLYGGTERVIWWLTEALVDLGHDVTLYASGDSKTSARLVPGAGTGPEARRDQRSHRQPARHARSRAERGGPLRHPPFPHRFPPFPDLPPPRRQVPDDAARAPGPARFPARLPHLPRNAAGLDLRRPAPADRPTPCSPAPSITACLEDLIPFAPAGGDYLAFIGRISPEKRPDRAIEIAKRAGMKLKIAAKVDHADRAYFADEIEPLLDDPADRVRRRDRRCRQARFPRRRARLALPDRLARAVRPGHDRGDGGGHAGHRLAVRIDRPR